MAPITINCVSVRRVSKTKCDPYCSHQGERRFTPKLLFADGSTVSFDHLVGEREQRRRNVDVERLSRLEVDDEFELACLHDRQIRWLFALEYAAKINSDLMIFVERRSIAHQAAGFRIVAIGKNCGYSITRGQCQQLRTTISEKRVRPNHKCVNPLLHEARESHTDLAIGPRGEDVDLPPNSQTRLLRLCDLGFGILTA